MFFSSSWVRTRERVEAAAEAAGLKCQLNGVQLLGFGEHLNSQDLKLMELNDDVIEELRLGRRCGRHWLSSDVCHSCTMTGGGLGHVRQTILTPSLYEALPLMLSV